MDSVILCLSVMFCLSIFDKRRLLGSDLFSEKQ